MPISSLRHDFKMRWPCVTTFLIGQNPSDGEKDFAQGLFVALAFLLQQNALLIPAFVRRQIWTVTFVTLLGLLTHAIVLYSSREHTLLSAAHARIYGALASLVGAALFVPRLKRQSQYISDSVTARQIFSRGLVVGLHAAASSFFIGAVFFLALSRFGDSAAAGAGIAFGVYGLLSSAPLAIAQATGLLTAQRGVLQEKISIRETVCVGVRVTSLLSLGIAIFYLSASAVLTPSMNSELSLALLGTAAVSLVDGPSQVLVWTLRAFGQQNRLFITTVGLGGVFASAAIAAPSASAVWVALFLFLTLLFISLRHIFWKVVPANQCGGE